MKKRSIARSRLYALIASVAYGAIGSAAHSQQLGTGKAVDVPIIQIIAGLFLCAFVAFGVVFMLRAAKERGVAMPFKEKRGSDDDSRRRIRIVETRRLSPHADICRLVAGSREFVIVLSPAGATVLTESEIDAPSPAMEPPS